jgi:hypothetical protein
LATSSSLALLLALALSLPGASWAQQGQGGGLNLKVRYGTPTRVEGKVEAGARYVTATCAGRQLWAPVDPRGRFSLPVRALRGPEGAAPLVVAGTPVEIKLGSLTPAQVDQLLQEAQVPQDAQQRALRLAALGSRLRGAGLPAMAEVVFARAWEARRRGPALDASAWRRWWTWALERAEGMVALGAHQEAAGFLQKEAAQVNKEVGQNTMMGMADQAMGLAELMMSRGAPLEGDVANARALERAAGSLRQRAGRLPRRLSPLWMRR